MMPALVAVVAGLNSCTAAIFALPEPKTRAEQIRNELSPLAIPVAVAVDVGATIPLLIVTGAARAAVCGVSEPAEPENQADKRTEDGSGSIK